MSSVFVSIIVFLLVALLLLCVVLLLASLKKPKVNKEKLPPCERVDLLSPKEQKMLADLETLEEKTGLRPHVKVGLGSLLKPKKGCDQEAEWTSLLREAYGDFVLCQQDPVKPRLVIMHGDISSSRRKEQLDLVERACALAGVPVLVVREYNLTGLEKAILQKAGKTKRKAAAPGDADSGTDPAQAIEAARAAI